MVIPQTEVRKCGLSWAAKVVCSGVFITGRAPMDIFQQSCSWMALTSEQMSQILKTKDPSPVFSLDIDIQVDKKLRAVTLTLDKEISVSARFFDDQGAIVVPAPEGNIHFRSESIPRDNQDRSSLPWPMGDDTSNNETDINKEKLNDAVVGMFSNPAHFTNAFIVLHKGKVVAEQYSEGYDHTSQFESWSMGKSISASLVGVLHQRGELSLDEACAFPPWQTANDPRAKITVRNLLNMASGLKFTGSFGAGEDHAIAEIDGKFVDHTYVYAGGIDSYEFCVNKPLKDPPDTEGRYRNCDPLLATALVRERACDGDRQAFLSWPQRNLFDRLGMLSMVLETDPYANFLISGHDYGCARDWARLGLLYAQRGAWGGEQILAEDFVEFVQTPAVNAWHRDPYYGGFFARTIPE